MKQQAVFIIYKCGGSDGKESTCNAEGLGLIPGLGRSPGGGHGNYKASAEKKRMSHTVRQEKGNLLEGKRGGLALKENQHPPFLTGSFL